MLARYFAAIVLALSCVSVRSSAQDVFELEWGEAELGSDGVLPVNLNTENGNEQLIGVEVDLFLEGFSFAALTNGRPNCLRNPRFRFVSEFWFLPVDCVGAACTGVHASLSVDESAEPAQRLFVCHFSVPESTEYGNYSAITASAQGVYASFEKRPLLVGGRVFEGRGTIR